MEKSCEEFLQCGDSTTFLVSVSEKVEDGEGESLAQILLQDKYRVILHELGWDLLSLLTPSLRSTDSQCWRLLQCITKVCSAKEMCLALLEQMEQVSDIRILLLLLQLLQRVLLELRPETAVVSSLRSACRLVQHHYSQLGAESEGSRTRELSGSEESEEGLHSMPEESEGGLHSIPEHSTPHRHCFMLGESGHEDSSHEYGGKSVCESQSTELSSRADVPETEWEPETREDPLSVFSVASVTLDFIHPFVEAIHLQYCKYDGVLQGVWSARQRECIAFLLSLLDYPLLGHSLEGGAGPVMESIMDALVRCHCGCVEIMMWDGGGKKLGQQVEEPGKLPVLGLASFAHLILVEGVCSGYLPSVVSHSHLLHINLQHARALMERPERGVILKGLTLLGTLVSRVSTHSLPSPLLDDKRYLQLAELLASVMVTCPHRIVRRQSVGHFLDIINCFSDMGRHRLYRSLLRSVTHPGVQGLLLHSIKEEVDCAFKALPGSSPFLGPDLVLLLDLSMTVSPDTDPLRESDRIMAALNFLRYLLIRDRPQENYTQIWTQLAGVREAFTAPLRQAMAGVKAHCRHQLAKKREQGGGKQGEPMVSVEVMGEELPELSPQEEIRMLHLAEYQLDMIESVLVRVEGLMENR